MNRPTRLVARSAALAAAALFTLSACGAAGEAEESAGSETGDVAVEETTEAVPEVSSTEAAAPAGEGTKVEIGQELTDSETGDVITIVSAVRNNPTEYYEASDNPDGEMVYLEVKVVPGEDYGGTISASDFYLDSAGEEVNYASTADDELTAAGFTYFERAPRRDGEHTGFIPVYVSQTADTLKGAYVRPEAKVLGEDQTIPEFRGDFEVPAS
ncbi:MULTISPECIES: hypothetical protein [Brevibacterium]|uniref:DUF4352 domain-containing protein n=1 Tax=Brevibacterium casei TaxID=33889 RepID=A0A7T3ZYQ5_9MICO|nr:hypothetical protein [Brevibacterium casei]QQB14143.1 hypothetical protein I6H47_15455 [Brevibacterium casei]